MNDCLRNSTLLSWVAGNDVLLLARVYEKVLDAGEVTDLPFDLSACDDISVTATNSYKKEVLEWAVAQDESNCLAVNIPHTLTVGEWAVEITCKRNGYHVRSFEFTFNVVETNCEAQTTFEVVDGCQSASVRVALQIVPQAFGRGQNSYEMWKELPGNEEKTLQEYIDEVLDLHGRAASLDAATQRAEAASEAAEQAAAAIVNPDYVGEDNYVYHYDKEHGGYVRTDIYVKGERGEKGEKGEKGDKGDRGERGADGLPGQDGRDGAPGRDGADGQRGEKGDKGDKGDTGATGAQGVKGDKGDAGENGIGISSIAFKEVDPLGGNVYTITLSSGSTADFTAPKGAQGVQGIPGTSGVGIARVTLNNDYTLTITFTDGTSTTTTSIRGAQGEKGEKGDKGNPGIGIPVGGSTGQVLAKKTGSDYDTEWVNVVTESVDDLVNYYLKSETYTKAEVQALIGAISQFRYEIAASTADVTNPANNVLYLIGPTGGGSDKYEEYVWPDATRGFMKIGDTTIDLSGYVTTTALNTALADYTTTNGLTTLLAGKQDTIDGSHKLSADLVSDGTTNKVVTQTEKDAWNGKGTYSKPSGGIPKTDLSSDVQTSLGKADTALQSFTESDPTVPSWAKQSTKPSYTAQEVGALPNSTKYGSTVDLTMDSTTYVLTLSLKDQDGTALNTKTVDLPIESVVVNGRYDSTNKKIVLTLQGGSTIDVPVGDLIAGLQTEITSVNMLDADLVDDTNSTHKFVTAQEKDTWNNKSDFSGSYNDLSDKPTIPTVPTNVSAFTNDAGYLTRHQDISGKEDKTAIVATSTASGVLNTEVGKYYRIDAAVDSMIIVLPAMTDLTTVRTVVIYLTAGTTPAVTITAADSKDVYYQDDFEIEAGNTYEINALFNGAAWVVAAVEINVE